MIDEATQRALFIDLHRDIHDVSAKTVARIPNAINEVIYPPDGQLTLSEKNALRELQLSDAARSGLQKLIAEASSTVVFNLFALIDGVADPSTGKFDPWLGISLAPKSEEDEPMLHDEFYESYWSYNQMK